MMTIHPSTRPSILLVDDDKELTALLIEYLSTEGFDAKDVDNGSEALNLVRKTGEWGALVLDIMMPGMSGLEVLQVMRREKNSTPVLMLTGRGDDIDRILGLEMGADDYLSKPCNPRELVARLRAILRRTQDPVVPLEKLGCHGIQLDSSNLEVIINGICLPLTGAEFTLLHTLMSFIGTTLSKAKLTETVLHRKHTAYDRSIDVHISRLRNKLSEAGVDPTVIKSIRGSGYQMIKDNPTHD